MRRSRAPVCYGLMASALLAAAGRLPALAQDTVPAFEVSSVKQVFLPCLVPDTRAPGRLTLSCTRLTSLISRAYGVPFWKIENAPDWARNDWFQVQAIFPPSSTPAQVNAMLKTLLEQRFRLSVHMEAREMDTDALIVAGRDGRLGPGLHPVDVDCETNELREGSAPGLFSSMKLRPRCGDARITVTFKPGDVPTRSRERGATRWAAITMTDLADTLSASRERPVLDRTRLPGRFDVELEYASNDAPLAALDAAAAASEPDSAPALPVALAQQLGLGLRRERNRVEVMVVRSVERPRSEEN